MARPNKLKKHIRELAKERKNKCDFKDSDRKTIRWREPQEHGRGSSEVEEDATAIGLLRRNVGSVSASYEADISESEDDELLVNDEEELEEVDESAFEKSIKSALEQQTQIAATGKKDNGRLQRLPDLFGNTAQMRGEPPVQVEAGGGQRGRGGGHGPARMLPFLLSFLCFSLFASAGFGINFMRAPYHGGFSGLGQDTVIC